MPDIPALALGLTAINQLDRWTDDRGWRDLTLAAVLAALAVLQKLTAIFITLPALYLFWLVYGKRLLARLQPYVYAVIVGVPALAWYVHATDLARRSGFAIMQPSAWGAHLTVWRQPAFLYEILTALSAEAFSPVGLTLAAVGLVWPLRGRAAWIFRWWVVGAACLLLAIPDLLPANHYYLSLLLPGGAALSGLVLSAMWVSARLRPILPLLAVLFAATAIHSALPLYAADRSPYDLGVLLRHLTATDDLILTESGGSPNVLYYAQRRGWMLRRTYDVASIELLRDLGARYYVDSFGPEGGKVDFFRDLDSHFERLTPEDAPGLSTP